MPRYLIVASITVVLLALYAWATPVLKSLDLKGDWLPAGDLYDGKLWLASPDYTPVPDDACWVIVSMVGNIEEKCVDKIGGIDMVIEDIRADGVRGRLWGAARYDTSSGPRGDAYILK